MSFKTLLDSIKDYIARLDQLPLVSAERHFWQRQGSTAMNWRRWLNLLIGWTVLLVSVVLYLSELLRSLLGGDINEVPFERRWLMGLYALGALIFYMAPWARANTLATQMIGRDKSRAQNWEMIVLTGVDARSYVHAKWWTLLRTLFPMLLPTAIVRTGAVTFLVAEFTRSGAANTSRYVSGLTINPPNVLDILLLGLLSFLFTYINLPSVCAVRLDHALDARRNGNTWLGSLQRNITFLGSGCLLFYVGIAILGVLGAAVHNSEIPYIVGLVLFSLFDNGLVLTGQLAAFTYYHTSPSTSQQILDYNTGEALLMTVVVLLLNVGVTWFWLKMAEWTALRYELVAPASQLHTVERHADVDPHPEAV